MKEQKHRILSIIRFENSCQISSPVILPLPYRESFDKLPVFRKPTTELPIYNSSDVPIIDHDIRMTKIAMGKHNIMSFLRRKHTNQDILDMIFRCSVLIRIDICIVKIIF
ncbi:uncharacterized protein AKAW2_11745A [Aspergillus luchuensis]|uniref:Uncharacterized protein n=1 Tax=Aspergillus kawachii TaxID=1069201 RepID=A0A7R7ZVF3_ASPKA|nr:uncharacterized protein AKAW2_11745A [Aspergillus luchuensis]BCR94699.1 hypothetical protein AKAW2_11745A [Aspergillus luchuensis]